MSTFHKDLQETDLYYSNGYGDYGTADRLHNIEESQYRYQNLMQENIRLRQDMSSSRKRSFSATCPNCKINVDYSARASSPQRVNDIVMWSMLERNKFLQDKVDKLKGMYEKQSHTLNSIRNSDKWKNRFQCTAGGSDCYEKKYFKLLRVRSPFY